MRAIRPILPFLFRIDYITKERDISHVQQREARRQRKSQEKQNEEQYFSRSSFDWIDSQNRPSNCLTRNALELVPFFFSFQVIPSRATLAIDKYAPCCAINAYININNMRLQSNKRLSNNNLFAQRTQRNPQYCAPIARFTRICISRI